jgi:hypothetical protein
MLQEINQSLRKQFFSTFKTFFFALKENAIHRRSKAKDPSTEFNPQWFGLPTDNSHWHRQKEEVVPHLHIEDNKSKA